jgi:signal transduction histidine kinase
MGHSFHQFILAADRPALRRLMKRGAKSGSKIQLRLRASDGSRLPAQISIRPLAGNGSKRATISMVITDMTDARRNEEMLRALTHRIYQGQEAERGRVAIELHDNITQLLCAVLYQSQALVEGITGARAPGRREATKLRAMLGHAAAEVERISRNLRPGMLEQLGFVEVLRETTRDFAAQAGVSTRVHCGELRERLPANTELVLYRILQEAFKNVEKHARASHVIVRLKQQASAVLLVIKDDGIGFNLSPRPASRKRPGLGLLSMRERASYVGAVFEIVSRRHAGTEIRVRIPVAAALAAG